MFKGKRGRGKRSQYGPKSQNRIAAHSSGRDRGQNARQIPSLLDNIWQPTPDSSNRCDEEERRLYEALQSHHDNHLLQKYKERVLQIEEDLYEEMEFYQKNPYRHPKYDSEWNEYWNGRTEDLLRKGEDPMNYDIKGEFSAFWDIKLRELFQDIFQKEKAQLLQEVQLLLNGQPSKLMANESVNLQPLIPNKRSSEPVILEKKVEPSGLPIKRIKPTENPEAFMKSTSNVTVISVLRQLSVLENHLGSLGPKVVDLLSKALLLEKSTGAIAVLKVESNCIMLETVMEKLKGLLQAAMIPQSIIGVTEKAISDLSHLLTTLPSEKFNQLYVNEKISFSETDKKKFQPDGLKPHPGDGKTLQDDRKSYPDERLPYDFDKTMTSQANSFRGRQPYPGDKKTLQDDRKSYPDDRSSYDFDKTMTSQSNSFRSSQPYPGDRKPYQDESSLHQGDRNSYRERKPYTDERLPHDPSQVNSFRDRKISQNKRIYKVSEISYTVENFGFLSHLSALEKTAIAQEIASSLLSRGQMDITEDELLDQISAFTKKSQYPADDYYGKRDTEAYGSRSSSGYDQFLQENSRRQSSSIPSLFDNPVHSDLDSLYGINRSSHSSYEKTTSYFPRGGNTNSSDRSAPVTYPLNSNPYQSSSQRKY